MKRLKILVLGAGSIGIFLGVKLNKSKTNDVLLLGRKKLQDINDTILVGNSVFEVPKKVFSFPKNKKFDIIFITSKLYDLEKNIELLNESNIQTKYLVSIQNSIIDKSIFDLYKYDTCKAFLTVFEGYRLVDNQLFIQEGNPGWKISNTDTGLFIADLLQKSGINCAAVDDIETLRAEKTIMNCSVNVLSAVSRKTFYELFSDKKMLKRITLLFDESYDVMSRYYKLRNKEELRLMFFEFAKLMKHYSSTYQDLLSGRATEVAFLNGLVIDMGKKIGIDAKENRKIMSEFNLKVSQSTTLKNLSIKKS